MVGTQREYFITSTNEIWLIELRREACDGSKIHNWGLGPFFYSGPIFVLFLVKNFQKDPKDEERATFCKKWTACYTTGHCPTERIKTTFALCYPHQCSVPFQRALSHALLSYKLDNIISTSSYSKWISSKKNKKKKSIWYSKRRNQKIFIGIEIKL